MCHVQRVDVLKPFLFDQAVSTPGKLKTLVPDQSVSIPLWGPFAQQSHWIGGWFKCLGQGHTSTA